MCKCSICGKEIFDFGNNPYPVRTGTDERCCDACNNRFVIYFRMAILGMKPDDEEMIAGMLNNLSHRELIAIQHSAEVLSELEEED